MPRGINGEYYNYIQPKGSNYYTHPFLQIYNYVMHSADDKNPYLNTGVAPTAQIKFNKFIAGESLKGNSKLLDLIYADWKSQLQRLKTQGVTADKQSVIKALQKREKLIHSTAPREYIDHTQNITPEGNVLTLNKDGKRNIGDLQLLTHSDNTIYPSMIRNNTINQKYPIRGVSEKLYNGAIQVNKDLGFKGFKVGEVLSSPEKTTKVYQKFSNKKELSQKGQYHYNNGIKEGPIYILQEPTINRVPIKSRQFDMSTIDNNGQMYIDWNNPNILKIGVPIVIGNYVYRRNQQ